MGSFLSSFASGDWGLAALIAAGLYGLLLAYLGATKHMTFKSEASSGAGCVDHREHVKYRVPGGTGTFSFGLVPLIVWIFFPAWTWLLLLAKVQFLMSCVDILLLWGQFIAHPGKEFVLLRSHGIRHPGCGRTSAWDPIGGGLYLIQIFTGWKWLGYVRGFVQLPYDIVGTIPAFLLNLPALLVGKFVVPLPF